MHESMRPAEPDAEQLRASLIAEHGEQQIMLNGQSIAFRDYVAVGEMLCPVPAEQRTPEDNLRRLTKELVKLDVQLDEKYTPYIPEQPKQEHSQRKVEPKKETVEKPAQKVTEKAEPITTKPGVLEITKTEAAPVLAVMEEKHFQPKKVVPLSKAAIAQTVQLELPVAEKVRIIKSPIQPHEVVMTSIPIEQIRVSELNVLSDEVEGPVKATEQAEPSVASIEVVSETLVENNDLLQEKTVDLFEPESEQALPIEFGEGAYEEFVTEETFVSLRAEEVLESTTEITGSAVFEEVPPTALDAKSVPDVELLYVVESVPPVTVTTEFIAQVLPTKLEIVAEQLQTMEPEVATELASRIEMIVVVADRLHDLVVAESTEGPEAKQIVAFLKREYEQVLMAVGLEVTDEVLEEFIAYIFSDSYTLQVPSAANYVDIADEGTHEKKLFDEQSVFAKAQHASTVLSHKLGNSIGHILLTNIAS